MINLDARTDNELEPGSAEAGAHGRVFREVSPAQEAVEARLVDNVVASFDECEDPRLKELMVSLVKHVHSFIRETRLTKEEWGAAIEFLTKAGHVTDEVRQEFILLSDTLGASMQTINVNNRAYANATEATVFGPFFVEDSPRIEVGGDMAFGAPGSRAGRRARSPTPTATRWAGRGSRCGRRTRTGSTTCSTTPGSVPPGRTCSASRTGATGSGG